MIRNLGRTFAATAGAMALVVSGVSLAAAADSVSSNPKFGGTFALITDSNADPVTSPFAWNQDLVASFDATDQGVVFPADASSTGAWTFLAPQGSEYDVNAWAAKNDQGGEPSTGLSYVNITPEYQTYAASSTQGAVRAAGGNWSLGLAYTSNGDLTVDKVYFIHVTITPGTGVWTYSTVEVAKTPTTTTLTAPATGSAATPVSLSAAVAPAGATGTVEFREGTTVLASDSIAPYTADVSLAAGPHSITAAYLGDATYAASASAASTVVIAGNPITTTTAVTATPAASGNASDGVVYTATITPSGATGTVTFKATSTTNPATVVTIGSTSNITAGVATMTMANVPAGSWTINASFVGTGLYVDSAADAAAPLVLTASSGSENPAVPDEQNIQVTVPKGSIVITTPFTSTNPLDLGTLVLNQAESEYELAAPIAFVDVNTGHSIKVQNTRPDHRTWEAFVESSDFSNHDLVTGAPIAGSIPASHVSMIDVTPSYIGGNAIQANVTPSDIAALSGTAQRFAQYTGDELGTVIINAKLDIDEVPTSTPAGLYKALLTFTAY